jgi:hypothetical protein
MTSLSSIDTGFKFRNKNSGAVNFCVHAGPSMKATLRELDVLEIVPYRNQEAKCGDVIFFVPPKGRQPVIHRITRITSRGVRTRGDNNDREDPWLLPHGSIGGKAVAAWRGRKRRGIRCGKKALLAICTMRRLRSLKSAMFHAIRPIYRTLARSGLLHRLVPARYRPRIVFYRSKDRDRVKLILGKRIVGYYDSHLHQWHITPPFRLLVNPASLACASGAVGRSPCLG